MVVFFGNYFKVTGYVTSSLSLAKSDYSLGEILTGSTSIIMYTNDLIPQNSTVCLEVWNSSTRIGRNCTSLTAYLAQSDNSSCFSTEFGTFNETNYTDRDWEGNLGYGFYGNCTGNMVYTVDASFFSLPAPSQAGSYQSRINVTYTNASEGFVENAVTVSADSSFTTHIAPTEITVCSNLTQANTYYILDANPSGNQLTGKCIDIQVDNIILDCQGHSITGTDTPNTYGIYAGSRDNITIKDCIVRDYPIDIKLESTTNSKVVNNTVSANTNGIYVYSSNYNNLTDNIIINSSSYGIRIDGSMYNRIYNNFFNNSNNVDSSNYNYWNTTRNCDAGPNIIGGDCLGGNFWATPTGTGFSQNLTKCNPDTDGICKNNYTISPSFNIDYLPLTNAASSISSCTTITNSGPYALTTDISAGGVCLTINANNVAVDCQGHWINTTGENGGIYASNKANLTIKNCKMKSGRINIFFNNITHSKILNNRMYGNGEGIYMAYSSNYNLINNNTLTGSSPEYRAAITLVGSSNNNITNNTIYSNERGIYFYQYDSSHNRIINNNISSNTYEGIYLGYDANWIDISNNTLISNGEGIFIGSTSRIDITNNNISLSTSYGIEADCAFCNIYNNLFNNTNNAKYISGTNNKLNTDYNCAAGPNIIGGSCMGGNFWVTPTGTGHSEDPTACRPRDDGICNFPLSFATGNIDNLPLTKLTPTVKTIDSCKDITVGNEQYVLTQNLAGDPAGRNNCIAIQAENVSLDCNGYSIVGAGSKNGIEITANNATIQNCFISNWSIGINTTSSVSKIYNNYFNNSQNAFAYTQNINYWNTTKNCSVTNIINGPCIGGNYWSDYVGVDSNADSLGDSAYVINTNNTDSLPLIITTQIGCMSISIPGYYILTQNVDNSTELSCIEIQADNVVFDCQGRRIDGKDILGSKGISVAGTNVTIKNCNITDWEEGIKFVSPGTNNNTVINNNIFSNSYGLNATNSLNNTIYNNFFNNTASNAVLTAGYKNYLNTAKTAGINIIGGNYTAGNYWANAAGTGPSQTCPDNDLDGICEAAWNYTISTNNTDYLPLTRFGFVSYCMNINQPGSFKLIQNITNSGASTCINISANNVILDCQNYMINGQHSGVGIYVGGRNNVTIKNCKVTDWGSAGVYLASSTNLALSNINSSSNLQGSANYGIFLSNVNNSNFSNINSSDHVCDGSGCAITGIYIDSSFNNKFSNITASNNYGHAGSNNAYSFGIQLLSSSNNSFSDVKISDNNAGACTATAVYGLYLSSSSKNTFSNLVSWHNWGDSSCNDNGAISNVHGVYLTSSNNNTFSGISSSNHYAHSLYKSASDYGIYLSSSSNNAISNSNASNNTALASSNAYSYGIYASSASNTNISNSNASNNAAAGSGNSYGYGIYLASSSNNSIINNTANANSRSGSGGTGRGIDLASSSNNNLTNNTVNLNIDYNIILESSSNNNNIINNTANEGSNGIYIGSSTLNNLTSNYANNNTNGIILSSSSSNKLTNNTANANINYNIILESSSNNNNIINNTATNASNGIHIGSSTLNNLTSNYANNNTNGIILYSSSSNKLTNNYANNNSAYGIYLTSSSSNNIYNNFFNNTNNINVDTNANNWNTTFNCSATNIIGGPCLGGNFWANLSDNQGFSQICTDGNSDGICDRNYTLISGNIDLLPLTIKGGIGNCTNITQSGDYVLINNIMNSAEAKCININASNVTLDCQGHIIDGDDYSTHYGIYASARENITIYGGCTLNDWGTGIYISNSKNVSIKDSNTINSSSNNGITFYNCSNSYISHSTVQNSNNYGIYLYLGNNNSLINENSILFNNIGIVLASANNTIAGNSIAFSTIYGISVSSLANSNNIYNNYFNNTNNTYISDGTNNKWNTTLNCGTTNIMGGSCIGGNFWATPTGTGFSQNLTACSLGPNSICQNSYNITDNDIDYLPLSGIVSCANITNSGTFNLLQDISSTQPGRSMCLDIQANNVTIDCGGYHYSISGSGSGYGIFVQEKNNITIKNCEISNYTTGILLNSSSNNTIYNNLLNNTANIQLISSSGNIWNTTKILTTNIIGGNYTGGNFWASPSGTGFSQNPTLCSPSISWQGLCRNYYEFSANRDYLPITSLSGVIESPPVPPIYSNLKANITSPANYSPTQTYQFNATWTDNDAISRVLLEWNNTNLTVSTKAGDEYYYNLSDLTAGTYSYRWLANDTSNNWNSTAIQSYVINKSSSEVNLTLNSFDGNISIAQGNSATKTCSLISPASGNVSLYQNGTLLLEGQSGVQHTSTYHTIGTYNITCIYNATQNYSLSSETHWLTVTELDTTPPTATLNSPNDNNLSSNTTIIFNCSAIDNSLLENITLYGNWSGGWHANETKTLTGASNSTIFTKNIADGKYVWNCLAYDNSGNSAFAGSNRTLTIDSTSPAYSNDADDSAGSIVKGITVNAGAYWQDNNALNTAIFATNQSGSWQNVSTCSLTGTSSWCNKTISTTIDDVGKRICWKQYANDTAGNLNSSMPQNAHCFNVIAGDSPPAVILESPANDSIKTSSNNIDFKCNATDDYNLTNITFYWNYSGSWQSNGTVSVSGTANNSTFQRTNLVNTMILWNCRAGDNASNYSFAANNWTVNISYSGGMPSPNCHDEDNDGYYRNDTNCLSGTDCNDDSNTTHPGATEVCNGVDDNCDGATDEGCGGGGGGGGGGGAAPAPAGQTFNVGSFENIRENSYSLGLNDKLKFKYFNADHEIWIVSLETNYAIIQFASNPRNITLYIGQTEKLDTNDNGYYDFAITLNGIANSKADITTKILTEAPTPPTKEKTGEEITYPGEVPPTTPPEMKRIGVIIYVVVALLMLVIFMIYLSAKMKKYKGRHEIASIEKLLEEGRMYLKEDKIAEALSSYNKVKSIYDKELTSADKRTFAPIIQKEYEGIVDRMIEDGTDALNKKDERKATAVYHDIKAIYTRLGNESKKRLYGKIMKFSKLLEKKM